MTPITKIRVFEQKGYIYLDFRVEGKRYRPSTQLPATKKNLKYVEKNKFALVDEWLSSQLEYKDIILFSDIALTAVRVGAKSRKPDTQKDIENILYDYVNPYFGKMDITKITASSIEKWIDSLNDMRKKIYKKKNKTLKSETLSLSRFNKIYRVLTYVINYALKSNYIQVSPLQLVDKKTKQFQRPSKNNTKYYTQEEVKKILADNSDMFLNTFLHFLYLTGARTGEALALRWDCIDWDKNTITIKQSIRKGVLGTTKTGVSREIMMSKTLKEKLLLWKSQNQNSVWVFPNPKTSKPYTEPKSIVERKFKPLLKKLGIEYKTLYATRHTFASMSLEKQLPLTFIQETLGHSELDTTLKYYVKGGLLSEDKKLNYLNNLYA